MRSGGCCPSAGGAWLLFPAGEGAEVAADGLGGVADAPLDAGAGGDASAGIEWNALEKGTADAGKGRQLLMEANEVQIIDYCTIEGSLHKVLVVDKARRICR